MFAAEGGGGQRGGGAAQGCGRREIVRAETGCKSRERRRRWRSGLLLLLLLLSIGGLVLLLLSQASPELHTISAIQGFRLGEPPSLQITEKGMLGHVRIEHLHGERIRVRERVERRRLARATESCKADAVDAIVRVE